MQLNSNYNSPLFRLNEKKFLNNFNKDKLLLTDFQRLFQNWIVRLTNIYVNRIKWNNLPLEIEPWFIERAILNNGVCVFFKEDVSEEYAVTYCNLHGSLNLYNIPTQWTAYAPNGFQMELSKKNAVLIYNNNDFFPDYNILFLFAERLAYMSIIHMKNIALQKNSIAVVTTKDTMLSAKNIVNQVDNGQDYIFLKDTYNLDNIKPLNLQVEFKADKIRAEMDKEFSDFLNWCGIESFMSNKKERLVSGETGGNDGYTEIQRNIVLNARRLSADRINRMFGLNIEPAFNSEIATLVNMGQDYVTKILNGGGSSE